MNCPACGADNREGARFCRSCGHQLDAPEVQSPADTPEPPAGEMAAETRVDEAALEETLGMEMLPEEGQVIEGAASSEVAEAAAEEPRSEGEGFEAEAEVGHEALAAQEEDLASAMEEVEGALEKAGSVADQEVLADAVDLPEVEEETDIPPESEADEFDEDELLPEAGDEVFAFWREEAEPMTAIEPGTVVGDRFAVIEALDVQEDQILYRAQDLQRCWQCGYEGNDAEGVFCGRCGVLMDRRPDVRLMEVQEPETEPLTDLVVVAHLAHDSRHLLLLAEPVREPQPEVAPELEGIRLLVGQRSHTGLVRELDEDSLFVLTLSPTYESRTAPVLGLFAVADGMGGHAGGEVASRMALQVLVERVMQNIILPELAGELVLDDDILALLRRATLAANDAVYLARQKRESDMGTTLTTALIRDQRLFLAHVGDCRAYCWNAEGLEQLTTDHSVIASMIADGQAKPEEIYTHPHRSIIYRCVGDKPIVEVDANLLPLAAGDRIIICCDGLWEMIRDEGIIDVMMQEADPQLACDLLVRRANAAGGEDNISVIVVQVEAVQELED